MKGIILAGGSGTRLHPITIAISKQLTPIYDKPMIYYPLSLLMLAGIKDILIITTPEDVGSYKKLLGNGNDFGVSLEYLTQDKPDGLAQAFIIGEKFIGDNNVCLVLGDNIFFGPGLTTKLENARVNVEKNGGATIFGYQVKDPQRFGVVEFNEDMKVVSIDEKPTNPKSDYAVTGLYFYDNRVVDIAKNVKISDRGELEITCVNREYQRIGGLNVELLGRGFAWLDTGTPESLLEASQFVATVQKRQGYKVACIEEIAFKSGWISKEKLQILAHRARNNDYGMYLTNLYESKYEPL